MALSISVSNLEKFSHKILNGGYSIQPKEFSEEFNRIIKECRNYNDKDSFCIAAGRFAEELSENNRGNFAGIIYSYLCKYTEFMPNMYFEKFAYKGYQTAKRAGDIIHMSARLNDLRRLYYQIPEKLYNYIQVLYEQEKCLKTLVENYDTAIKSFKTITKKPALKKDYETMLAHVQTEIAKLTRKKHPHHALSKIRSAKEIFTRTGNKTPLEYLNRLETEIGNSINL